MHIKTKYPKHYSMPPRNLGRQPCTALCNPSFTDRTIRAKSRTYQKLTSVPLAGHQQGSTTTGKCFQRAVRQAFWIWSSLEPMKDQKWIFNGSDHHQPLLEFSTSAWKIQNHWYRNGVYFFRPLDCALEDTYLYAQRYCAKMSCKIL